MKSEFIYKLVRWLGIDLLNPRGLITIFLPFAFLLFLLTSGGTLLGNVLINLGWHIVYGLLLILSLFLLRVDTHAYAGRGATSWTSLVVMGVWLLSFMATSAYIFVYEVSFLSDGVYESALLILLVVSLLAVTSITNRNKDLAFFISC